MRARIAIDPGSVIAEVDPRIYGSFIEHMGRAVYTGIYEPGHPSADSDGFRRDVMELIRPLALSQIRYPGGNFLSGYRWEDGIGPKKDRPRRPELAWQAIESNQVGTDEFLRWCGELGTDAMLGVNLGTGTAQSAVDLLEYCNFPGGTHYSELRRKNGRAEPYGVKLWCLGNEMDGPWQICSKTAEEYGRAAHETARLMKLLDPSIELVACGSSYREMPSFGDWERTVLRRCWEDVDYLSLHQYYQAVDGDEPDFLANSVRMDRFIREVAQICREVGAEKRSEKKIGLSFDEWNVWYHFQREGREPEKWLSPRPVEEESFNLLDALLVGGMLTALINNADTVKIACLAQLVNVIAPIMTEPGGRAWTQTIYWPFLYTSRYGRGAALRLGTDGPSYRCGDIGSVPYLDAAAVLSGDGRYVSLFLVNKSLGETVSVCLSGAACAVEEWVCLSAPSVYERDTADAQPVLPVRMPPPDGEAALPPASWSMLRLRLAE